MELTFYDKDGGAVAYTEDGVNIYLFNGKPVGYIDDDSIYAYSGKHLGWFEDGWVRDHSGNCVFFTEIASSSGPIKAAKRIKPFKGIKGMKPIKKGKEIKPFKPIKRSSWSEFSGEAFFISTLPNS